MIAEGSRIDGYYYADFPYNIAILWAGTNDYWQNGRTAAQIMSDIETWCLARREVGFKTIVLTLHPENDAGYMAMRAEFNASLLANHDFCDAVADTSGETRLDPLNPIYYADHIHLTQAGYELISPFVDVVINGLIS